MLCVKSVINEIFFAESFQLCLAASASSATLIDGAKWEKLAPSSWGTEWADNRANKIIVKCNTNWSNPQRKLCLNSVPTEDGLGLETGLFVRLAFHEWIHQSCRHLWMINGDPWLTFHYLAFVLSWSSSEHVIFLRGGGGDQMGWVGIDRVPCSSHFQ